MVTLNQQDNWNFDAWKLDNWNGVKIPDVSGLNVEGLEEVVGTSITEDFAKNIWKNEADQMLKIIRTNYSSNIEEMPSNLQEFVKFLERISESSVEWFDDLEGVNLIGLEALTSQEKTELTKLVALSRKPNRINYLENDAYLKYLNIIERNLNLPRFALESICKKESGWRLYEWWKLKTSKAWAQWLFQFMPITTETYFNNQIILNNYWKSLNKKIGKFASKIDFLEDPLATAWTAWIMINMFMYDDKYGYDFQTSLACYNCGPVTYENRVLGKNKNKKVEKRNLVLEDKLKLSSETWEYVNEVTSMVLEKNSLSSGDIFATDLSKYRWSKEGTDWITTT